MRELERQADDTTARPRPAASGGSAAGAGRAALGSVALLGPGRLGRTLGRALRDAGVHVHGPWGRDAVPRPGDGAPAPGAVLLCVPDSEIRAAAAAVAGLAPLVGHTSGATSLAALAPAAAAGADAFGLHPLQSVTGAEADPLGRLAGAGCAVAGSTPAAAAFAAELARRLGMVALEIADRDRAAYHAAATVASNFLVTLEDAAETIAAEAGMAPVQARRALAPLVRATVENWMAVGPERALTGPVARGDEDTIAAQRAAIERAAPEIAPLFEVLLERTRALAARRECALAGARS